MDNRSISINSSSTVQPTSINNIIQNSPEQRWQYPNIDGKTRKI